jgi:hypothetical protein
VCDLETSRIGAPYVYDISNLRVKGSTSELDRKDWEKPRKTPVEAFT